MPRHYSITYERKSSSGSNIFGSTSVMKTSDDDLRKEITEEYVKANTDDPTFKIISVTRQRDNNSKIDWELRDRMRAVREICELGHRVRGEAKLRNRQPLKKAYILFSDKEIQEYMLIVDCGKDEYKNILAEELNVIDIEFVQGDINKFFNYNLKPNFRTLGPKGLGQLAQKLKLTLATMTDGEKNILYRQLKNGGSNIDGICLVEDDVEVEYVAKKGFASANSKFGAIIIDTTLDDNLLELGFISEFRSSIQNVRKESGLSITDKVFIEVFCPNNKVNVIEKHSKKLKSELLATDIQFFPPEEVDKLIAHEISIDGTTIYANIYKELE